MTLFRSEALENASVRKYGNVLLSRPLSFAFLTIFFVSISLLIILFFVFFSYTRKVQVVGFLIPKTGLIRVVAPQSGIVVERLAAEGQFVKAGQPLFILTNERILESRGDAGKLISSFLQDRRESFAAERGQLQKQLERRVEVASKRLTDNAADIARVEAQIFLQQNRVALAQESLKRFGALHKQNFVSAAQVQEKQGDALDQQQRLAELERIKAKTSRDASDFKAELEDVRVQARRDAQAAERNISAIQQEITDNESKRRIIVLAPQDGVLSGVSAAVSQSVTTNQAMAVLIPKATPLVAELLAPSSAAGFVKPGMEVFIRYRSFPYQKFGQHHGLVSEVSETSMRAEDLNLPGGSSPSEGVAEPLYRVRVALDHQSVTAYGNQQPLKSGMALEASVMLEKRRIYEWVLEPLYTVTGRL